MLSQENVDEQAIRDEVQRLMDVLRTLVRMLGYTNRDIERRANLNHATTVKNFQGHGEPRLEFILKVVRAIGLELWEFFELAYAERTPASEAGERVNRMLERLHPRPPRIIGPPEKAAAFPTPRKEEPPAPVPRQDLEKMFEDLRREVHDLFEAREKGIKSIIPPAESGAKPQPARRKKGDG